MLSAKVIRSKAKNYPREFASVNRKFLPTAGLLLEGAAKNNAPRDLGTLIGSIRSRNDDETATVFTPLEYAPYQEYGTRKMRAQPYMRPALDKNRKNIISLYQKFWRSVFGG